MITEQFLTYIRTETARGVPRAAIRDALILNGLTESEAIEAFEKVDTGIPASAPPPVESVWQSEVVGFNRKSLNMYCVALAIDLALVVLSRFSLLPFFIPMLVVFGVFMFFMYMENVMFAKRFAGTTSPRDKGIADIIHLRNAVFFMNFLPFVQILGICALVAPAVMLVRYAYLVHKRIIETPATPAA